MRSSGLGSAVISLVVASLACGGRAALEDRIGECLSRDDCDGTDRCEAGECVPGASGAAGASAIAGRGGAAGSECARSGCVVVNPPSAGGAGGFGTGAGGVAGSAFAGAESGGAAGSAGEAGSASPGGNAGSSGAPPVIPEPLSLLSSALLGATAVVSEPVGSRFFVALAADAPEYANSIVAFDPYEHAVVAAVYVGGNPSSLAMSDDGSTLWAGLHDTASVLRVDVATLEPLAEYALPPSEDFLYPHAAGPMVLLPGTTSSLAVSLHYDGLSPSFAGLVILDEGVPRPMRLPGHTGASRLVRGPDGYLLGYNNLHTGFGLYSITVTEDGLLSQTEHAGFVSGFDTDIAYDTNLLFASDGSITGVSNPNYPIIVGQLPATGLVIPDVAAQVVWVLAGARSQADSTPLSLVLVNLPTLAELDRNVYFDPVLAPRQFVRNRRSVFAFVADSFAGDGYQLESALYYMRP